jgi:hypothetical protein
LGVEGLGDLGLERWIFNFCITEGSVEVLRPPRQ